MSGKILIRKKDVSLSFLLSRVSNEGYKIIYIVNLIPKSFKSPERLLSLKDIDLLSLKRAIMANIDPYDQKYVYLKTFDDRRAIFIFDIKKWLKDALYGVDGRTSVSQFMKKFKFKKRLPHVILIDPIQSQFREYLIKEFIKHMEANRKEIPWFKYLFPSNVRAKMRGRIRNMFNWTYDFSWNEITATMKPVYILGILAAVGVVIKKYQLKNNEFMFSNKVKANLKKFNLKKFKSALRGKNLF